MTKLVRLMQSTLTPEWWEMLDSLEKILIEGKFATLMTESSYPAKMPLILQSRLKMYEKVQALGQERPELAPVARAFQRKFEDMEKKYQREDMSVRAANIASICGFAPGLPADGWIWSHSIHNP
jgi:hypothetical protein